MCVCHCAENRKEIAVGERKIELCHREMANRRSLRKKGANKKKKDKANIFSAATVAAAAAI